MSGVDQALYAVVMEAYVHGVSTQAVDDLVQALGIGAGISRQQVSRTWVARGARIDGLTLVSILNPHCVRGRGPKYVKPRPSRGRPRGE
jgi:hypothetical protein